VAVVRYHVVMFAETNEALGAFCVLERKDRTAIALSTNEVERTYLRRRLAEAIAAV